jgi:hypothetical protein
METFTESKPFVDNPFYREQRDKSLASLDINTIDAPIMVRLSIGRAWFLLLLKSWFGFI